MENSIILQNVTTEQLFNQFREIVREEMSFQSQSKKDPGYLTRIDVAKRLNISLPTLNDYTKQGKIPAYRIGGRVLYKENEIEDSLKQIVSNKFRK